jgi:hypothetical protein
MRGFRRGTFAEESRQLTSPVRVQAFLLAAVVSFWDASTARGAAYVLDARTEAQAYQIRSFRDAGPDNPVLLPRRRIVQSLGLSGFELVTGEDLAFESSVRVFADFGLPRGEAAKIDGLHAEEVELLYANARFRSGGVDLQLGRQVYVDIMEYMAFDGLRVRYLTSIGLGAEAYGGLWVKGGKLLGSSVYQPDGVRESDQRRIGLGAPATDPALDDLEPVYGVKLLAENLKGFSGSLGYRKALLGGQTDLERAAAELRFGRGLGLNVLAALDYDLFFSRVAQVRGLVRYDQARFAISAEVMRLSPVLSAESIWYYFASAPRDELRIRGDYTPVGPLRYYTQLVASLYHTELNSTLRIASALRDPALPTANNYGGAIGAAYRQGRFRSALDASYRTGFGGKQLWIDLTGGYVPGQGPYTIEGRISTANLSDGLNPLLRGTFVGAQLWGTYLFSRNARGSLVLEENINGFTRSDFKTFFLLDLKAAL